MSVLKKMCMASAGLAMACLALAGCSSPIHESDKPPAVDTTPSETPTPTPTPTLSPNAMLDQTVTVQDDKGYTVSLKVKLQLGEWVTSVADSLPGQAKATAPLEGGVLMTNTTAGRNTNPVFFLLPTLSYPAGSPACDAMGAPIGPVFSISHITKDGRYCLVLLTQLNGVLQLAPDEGASLNLTPGTSQGSITVGGAEGDLPGLIAAASQPSGMFLTLEAINGSQWGAEPITCDLNLGSYDYFLNVVAASPGFECVS